MDTAASSPTASATTAAVSTLTHTFLTSIHPRQVALLNQWEKFAASCQKKHDGPSPCCSK